jgi:transcriptional regulator with XRE-family HTH domain
MVSAKKPRRKKNDDRWFVEEAVLAWVSLKIAEVMQQQTISQRELAARLGISEVRVSQILNADKNVTLRNLARIAHALNCGLKIELIQGAAMKPPRMKGER